MRKTPKVLERHGLSGTPEHRIWSGLFQRCYNGRCGIYQFYGARGIKVDERWHRFTNFWNDMGLRPSKNHSIDRVDGTKNYAPENCRWATAREQCANLQTNVRIKHDGKDLVASEWARITGLSLPTILRRFHEGLAPEQILASARQWHTIKWQGETMPARTWARRMGIAETTFMRRLKKGWPLEMVMADLPTAVRYGQKLQMESMLRKADDAVPRAKEIGLRPAKRRNYTV